MSRHEDLKDKVNDITSGMDINEIMEILGLDIWDIIENKIDRLSVDECIKVITGEEGY